MTSASDYNNMEPILWRGRDYEKGKSLSQAFFKAADKLIAPKALAAVKPAKTTKRKTSTKPVSQNDSEKKLSAFNEKLDLLIGGEEL